mmetsp:Transcript_7496/g.30368  ORF Transcript_7496/g.30368 Transcript_7496/m.30368 type:complete len:277 (+) Transcript_7496:341-1171(+)
MSPPPSSSSSSSSSRKSSRSRFIDPRMLPATSSSAAAAARLPRLGPIGVSSTSLLVFLTSFASNPKWSSGAGRSGVNPDLPSRFACFLADFRMTSRSRLSSSSSAISCLERCATWLVCACAAIAFRKRSIRSTSSLRAISAARLDSRVSASLAYTSSSLMATSASSSMSSVSLSSAHTRFTSAPSFQTESVTSERVLVSRSSSVQDARLRSSLVRTSSASAFAASMRDRWCACVASYRSRATSQEWTSPAMPPRALASSGSILNMASISFARSRRE